MTQPLSFQIWFEKRDFKVKIPMTQLAVNGDSRPGLVSTISSCVTIVMRPHTWCRRPRRPSCSAGRPVGQTDRQTSAGINRHLSQALSPLTCTSLTGSSGSIHLLLIPSHHQSLNADPASSRTRTRTHSLLDPAVPGVLWRLLPASSERNDYHTPVSTCHRALPESVSRSSTDAY